MAVAAAPKPLLGSGPVYTYVGCRHVVYTCRRHPPPSLPLRHYHILRTCRRDECAADYILGEVLGSYVVER